jgi:hypothetical protein
MSHITQTKLNRQYTGSIKDGPIKNPKVEPPTNRTEETFEWRGVTLKTWMSPGQVINKEKLYKRYRKEQGYNY